MQEKAKILTGLALVVMIFVLAFTAVLAAPASAPACGVIHTTDLNTWDLSETRAQGHNELTEDGLHIWTESNTSLDKAAGYYPLGAPLSSINGGSIVYNASFGITPGLQVVTDFDGDGSIDGILVGEAVYGSNWWLTNSAKQFVKDGAPNTGGGNGSNWWGTLLEWSQAFPNANVVAIGYSLGSGVHGDGVIVSMQFGCYTFTFGLPEPTPEPTPEVTPETTPDPEATETPVAPPPVVFTLPSGGFSCRVFIDGMMTAPTYVQTLDNTDWVEWDGYAVQDPNKAEAPGMVELSLHANHGESVDYTYYRVVGANGGETRFFERTQGGVCHEVSDPLAAAE